MKTFMKLPAFAIGIKIKRKWKLKLTLFCVIIPHKLSVLNNLVSKLTQKVASFLLEKKS